MSCRQGCQVLQWFVSSRSGSKRPFFLLLSERELRQQNTMQLCPGTRLIMGTRYTGVHPRNPLRPLANHMSASCVLPMSSPLMPVSCLNVVKLIMTSEPEEHKAATPLQTSTIQMSPMPSLPDSSSSESIGSGAGSSGSLAWPASGRGPGMCFSQKSCSSHNVAGSMLSKSTSMEPSLAGLLASTACSSACV